MTKGERREQKRNNSRKMRVSGRNTATVYRNAVLKRKGDK